MKIIFYLARIIITIIIKLNKLELLIAFAIKLTTQRGQLSQVPLRSLAEAGSVFNAEIIAGSSFIVLITIVVISFPR